jgi:outer membrane receptor protein involved in Fe transport
MSASLFYKKLRYPMAIYQMYGNADYQLLNDKDAKNYGIELEARKSFAFTGLPVLRNITLYGNFTYLDARVRQMSADAIVDPENPNRLIMQETVYATEKRPQSGASNYMYNAGFYFDTKPVSVSLVYNSVTNRMFRPAGPGHQNESLYEQPLRSLDGQVAVHFLHRQAEVKINLANLLNSYSVIYQNRFEDPDLSGSKKDPSKKEAQYQAGKDLVNYKVAPGRTYSITLSYIFK